MNSHSSFINTSPTYPKFIDVGGKWHYVKDHNEAHELRKFPLTWSSLWPEQNSHTAKATRPLKPSLSPHRRQQQNHVRFAEFTQKSDGTKSATKTHSNHTLAQPIAVPKNAYTMWADYDWASDYVSGG
jgi:hypothetical protein